MDLPVPRHEAPAAVELSTHEKIAGVAIELDEPLSLRAKDAVAVAAVDAALVTFEIPLFGRIEPFGGRPLASMAHGAPRTLSLLLAECSACSRKTLAYILAPCGQAIRFAAVHAAELLGNTHALADPLSAACALAHPAGRRRRSQRVGGAGLGGAGAAGH